MSTSSQNPYPIDEFDRITASVPMVSVWEAMFSEAEEMLRQSCPDGFDVLDIGRAAMDSLPESEKEAALDVLFYTYWAARQSDLEARARKEARRCDKGHERTPANTRRLGRRLVCLDCFQAETRGAA